MAEPEPVQVIPYKRLFVGGVTRTYSRHGTYFDRGHHRGCTLLAELPTPPGRASYSYACVDGLRTLVFSTREPVESFVSPMGNNLIPCPFAITRSHALILNDYGPQQAFIKLPWWPGSRVGPQPGAGPSRVREWPDRGAKGRGRGSRGGGSHRVSAHHGRGTGGAT